MRITDFKTTITDTDVRFSTSLDINSLELTGSLVIKSDVIALGNLSCANLRGGTVLQPYTLSFAQFSPASIGDRCYFVVPMESKLLAAYGITNDTFIVDTAQIGLCNIMGARLSTTMTVNGPEHTVYTLTPDYTNDKDRRIAYVRAGGVLFFDTLASSISAMSLSLKLEPLLKGGQYV